MKEIYRAIILSVFIQGLVSCDFDTMNYQEVSAEEAYNGLQNMQNDMSDTYYAVGYYYFRTAPEYMPSEYKKALQSIDCKAFFVLEAGLEPAQPQWPKDFKSFVSTIPPFEQFSMGYRRTDAKIKSFQFANKLLKRKVTIRN